MPETTNRLMAHECAALSSGHRGHESLGRVVELGSWEAAIGQSQPDGVGARTACSPLSSTPIACCLPDQSRQPLSTAPAGDHAEADVVVGDPGVVADEHDVGGLHQLETARRGDAFDGRHHGNLDSGDGVAGPAKCLEQRAQRCGALSRAVVPPRRNRLRRRSFRLRPG